ncbi:MAG TPA: hypothetical protein QF753_11205 [Victivallales bacterium]|nr:hypothetical protein [Victivallales bacterium]
MSDDKRENREKPAREHKEIIREDDVKDIIERRRSVRDNDIERYED